MLKYGMSVWNDKRVFCIFRQLTDSAAGKGYSGSVNRNKLLNRIKNASLWKMKMSMQNHTKLLMQLKDFLHKSGYDKSLQIILSKNWLDFLQKVTYSQINTLKKLSPIEFSKNINDTKLSDVEKCNNSEKEKKNVILETSEEKTLTGNTSECKKVSPII